VLEILSHTTNQPSRIKRCPARPSGAPRLHVVERPPLRVEQGRAEIEDVARGLAHQRERGRTPRAEASGQRALLESEMRLELVRQHPHRDVVRQADDLDRLDAMVGRGALDAAEQLLDSRVGLLLSTECRKIDGPKGRPRGARTLGGKSKDCVLIAALQVEKRLSSEIPRRWVFLGEAPAVGEDVRTADPILAPDMGMPVNPHRCAARRDEIIKIGGVSPIQPIVGKQRIQARAARRVMRHDDRPLSGSARAESPQRRRLAVEGGKRVGRTKSREDGPALVVSRATFHKEELAAALSRSLHGIGIAPLKIRPQRCPEDQHAAQVRALAIEDEEPRQMAAENCRRVIDHAFVVVMVAGYEDDAGVIGARLVGEAQHALALRSRVAVVTGGLENSGVAQIARDNQHIPVFQRQREVLGLKVQIAQVVETHRVPQSPGAEDTMRRDNAMTIYFRPISLR